VVLPTLEGRDLLHTRLGRSIVGSTIIEDIAGLVLLSLIFQIYNPTTFLPLPAFIVILVVFLFAMRLAIPKVRWFFSHNITGTKDRFQQELRSIFVILIGTVILFELIGLHSIIAGFFAGLVMSGSIGSKLLKEKLRAISYGLFIPIFFVLLGIKVDLGVFADARTVVPLVIAVLVASMSSKFVSGYLGAYLAGFSKSERGLVGAATIPQLSTTLAVTFTAFELGIFSQELITVMVILSIVTVFTSPVLIRYFHNKREKERGMFIF